MRSDDDDLSVPRGRRWEREGEDGSGRVAKGSARKEEGNG